MTQRLALVVMVGLLVNAAAILVLGSEQPPAQEEFIPIDQLPPEDQLPAAPLLITAYAIVWIVVFVYLWSIWRRLLVVEREVAELSRRADGDEESRS